tara:strand:- start:216 stop:509 length:294 start_codon:yes stop_codon:yes gene_type:complete
MKKVLGLCAALTTASIATASSAQEVSSAMFECESTDGKTTVTVQTTGEKGDSKNAFGMVSDNGKDLFALSGNYGDLVNVAIDLCERAQPKQPSIVLK